MNILITGGTGFIGQLIINTYNDYQYTVLTRNSGKIQKLFQSNKQVESITSLDQLADLNAYDVVINLAGEPIADKRWSDRHKRVIEHSRWGITQKLVDLFDCSSNPPAVFLSGSAIGVYGDHGDNDIDESSVAQEKDFSSNLCEQWESIAGKTKECTRLAILRTGVVLHPDFGALQRMLPPFKLGLGGRIGSGQQYFSWIHWQDMVSAIHHLMITDSASGAFNMTAPGPVTNLEFTKSLGRAISRPTIFPMPEAVLRILMGESADLLVISQKVMPRALVDSGFEFNYTDVQSALNGLIKRK